MQPPDSRTEGNQKAKSKPVFFWILGALAIFQLALPAALILSSELEQSQAQRVFLPVEPVDPYDPLRGRYLVLRPYLPRSVLTTEMSGFLSQTEEFRFRIVTDPTLRPLSLEPTEDARIYLTLEKSQIAEDKDIYLNELRFYLQENLARSVEERLSRWDDWNNVELEVLIGENQISPLKLHVDGKPVEDWNSDLGIR